MAENYISGHGGPITVVAELAGVLHPDHSIRGVVVVTPALFGTVDYKRYISGLIEVTALLSGFHIEDYYLTGEIVVRAMDPPPATNIQVTQSVETLAFTWEGGKVDVAELVNTVTRAVVASSSEQASGWEITGLTGGTRYLLVLAKLTRDSVLLSYGNGVPEAQASVIYDGQPEPGEILVEMDSIVLESQVPYVPGG